MGNQPNLAEHVTPPVSDARMDQMWSGISDRMSKQEGRSWRVGERPGARWLWPASAVAIAFAAMLVVWVTTPGTEARPSLLEGAALETAGDGMAVDLNDGSILTLAPRSRVALEETGAREVRLTLERGAVVCEVEPDKKRAFVVQAGGVSVRVVGTVFRVARQSDKAGEFVGVDVERGVVEVTSEDGSVRRLAAGESWSRRDAPVGDEVEVAALEDAAVENAEESPAADVVSHEPSEAHDDAGPRRDDAAADQGEAFEQAMRARRAGRTAEAASLLSDFVHRFPSDGRAGVAAFELGRLRMDQLGDLEGAARVLDVAVRRGAGGLQDDALARLVRARAALGQTSDCRKARAEYLENFPTGVHIDQVKQLCAK